MNLFRIKPDPKGIDRMRIFLKDNFVSIAIPGIGDLESVDGNEEGSDKSEEAIIFSRTMQDGDYVLVPYEDSVYLGDLGDYYYVESPDPEEDDGMRHRRGVTWLNRIPLDELNEYVQELVNDRSALREFGHPLSLAQLDRWISFRQPEIAANLATSGGSRIEIDKETIAEAIAVMKEAMKSEDAERRERAAAAILNYASSSIDIGKPT
ncbi:hypothetical protein [Cohnella lupini]|uniref:Uncharacterized protein n=1 Tax=Cohnella lupini TaxID=1294267 RepID=A0A3D9IA08_9BACL|nr:hypothetical protein [Cohnella lupini]RED58613.1 hypothetical protein DFP95_108140 [Cohnella lupini]